MSIFPMLRQEMNVFLVKRATYIRLPPHIREAADAMFDEFGNRFEIPTKARIIAAVCDPPTKRLGWLYTKVDGVDGDGDSNGWREDDDSDDFDDPEDDEEDDLVVNEAKSACTRPRSLRP